MTAPAEARRMPAIHAPGRVAALASVGLVVAIGLLAYAIISSQQQSRSRILSSFALRATSSATFVSEFLAQQRGGDPGATGRVLSAIVEHTISYPQHHVYLANFDGALIASSPQAGEKNLLQADPVLVRAALHASTGPVAGAREPSTFTIAPVAGRSWWLLVEVPDSRLYVSIGGWTDVVAWLALSLVSVLGVLLVALLARSHADRARLRALLSPRERTARGDSPADLELQRAKSARAGLPSLR